MLRRLHEAIWHPKGRTIDLIIAAIAQYRNRV